MLLVQGDENKVYEKVSTPDLTRWSSSFERDLFSSIRNEIIWRLPLLYLLFGVLTGFIMSYNNNMNRQHSIFIIIGISLLLALQFYITRVSDSKRLMDVLYLICGITAIVPFGFLVSWQYDYFFLLLVFFTQALCWMIFPWSISKSLCWAIFLLSYWAIILNINDSNLFQCIPLFPIMCVAVVIPRIKFQEINLHQAHIFMTKLSTSTQNNMELCFLLSRLILSSLDAKKALLLTQDGRLFALGDDYCRLNNNVTLAAASLFTLLKDRKDIWGRWRIKKDDIARRAFIYDTLETKAGKFQYYFLRTVEKGKEIELLLLVPNMNMLDTISFMKVKNSIQSLCDIYNISLFTLRNQNMSNDTVLAYGTALAGREKDINQLVHTVNNNSQEITIHCDLIRQQISSFSDSTQEASKLVLEETSNIEDNIRMLTQTVSDIKLIREIAALRALPRNEKLALNGFFSELSQYAFKAAENNHLDLIVKNEIQSEKDGVNIPSADYFATIMRALIRAFCSSGSKSGRVYFSVWRENKDICFDCAGESFAGMEEEELYAVKSYVKFSGGTFEELKGVLPYSSHVRIKFAYCEVGEVQQVSSGNWILLVDDNPQVVTFYSRIAEALGMQYKIASSYDEARSILSSQSKPKIVITDIQLSNSSGLDLVRYVRENFTHDLPVIVVSGNDDMDISSKAYEAGATKYLKKPLGRKKLFSEIEGLLYE